MEKYSTYERNERKVKEYNAWRIVKSISKFLHFLHLSSVVTTLIFTLLNFHNILVTAQIPNFINSGSAVGSGLAKNVKDVSRSGEPSRIPPSMLGSCSL